MHMGALSRDVSPISLCLTWGLYFLGRWPTLSKVECSTSAKNNGKMLGNWEIQGLKQVGFTIVHIAN